MASKKKKLPSDTTKISPAKAHEMLKDGTAHGKPLTPKQKRFLGVIYTKGKSKGY